MSEGKKKVTIRAHSQRTGFQSAQGVFVALEMLYLDCNDGYVTAYTYLNSICTLKMVYFIACELYLTKENTGKEKCEHIVILFG